MHKNIFMLNLLCITLLRKSAFCFLCMYPDNLKKHVTEIEMKPNEAYETVTRPQPATRVHTEPCAAYGVVVQAHH